MSHVQQQILDAIKAALVDETDADARVFVDRVDPVKSAKLPYILITEVGDQVAEASLSSDERIFDVEIVCALELTEDHAAEARAFGLAVEEIVAADDAIGALCAGGHFITSSRPLLSGEGEKAYAGRLQGWRFIYHVDPEAPDVAL